jgi:hypothetical protein
MDTNISGCLAGANYVVIGFFTPSYRRLAEEHTVNLSRYAIPHMLYAWEEGTWNLTVMAKPAVVRRAMCEFPGRTIVLMDVDCDVRGPIAPAVDFPGDISLWIGVGVHLKNEPGWRTRAMSSSRLLMWRQTDRAKRLLNMWCELTEKQLPECALDEEQTLIWAIEGVNNGLVVTILDRRYAARNPWHCPADSVIVHKTPSPEITSRSLLSPEDRVRA